MTAGTGSNDRIARVLSATLQALVAEDVGGDSPAAFMLEFRDEFAKAEGAGFVGIRSAYHDLFLDMSGALYSLSKYVAEKTGEDPRAVLGQLIRTYRKAHD